MKLDKIKPNKVYKVEWLDIQANSNVVLKKPFNQFLAPSWTVGYVSFDKDTVIVQYGANAEEQCFDAIPKKVVTNIIEI